MFQFAFCMFTRPGLIRFWCGPNDQNHPKGHQSNGSGYHPQSWELLMAGMQHPGLKKGKIPGPLDPMPGLNAMELVDLWQKNRV